MNDLQKKNKKIKLERLVVFEDFLDTTSEYFEKMNNIISSKPYSNKTKKGYNLHHTIPRSISRYFGEKPQDDNMVLLSISEHFLVHYYMDKCRKDGFGHYLAPSWRLILSNNKSLIMSFVSSHQDLGALILSEILNTKSFNFTENDKDNFTYKKQRTKDFWYERAERAMETKIFKFFDENIPDDLQIPFIDFLYGLDISFSISEVRKIWGFIKYLAKNPEEIHKIFYCVIHYYDYIHYFRSETVKNTYTPELRHKRSEDNRNRDKSIYKKISEKQKGRQGRQYTEDEKKKVSERVKGTKWYNNGIKNIMIKGDPPEGYVPGRIK